MRSSVAITGDFTAQEVIRIVSVAMVGETHVYDSEGRHFHGKIVLELVEIVDDPDEQPSLGTLSPELTEQIESASHAVSAEKVP